MLQPPPGRLPRALGHSVLHRVQLSTYAFKGLDAYTDGKVRSEEHTDILRLGKFFQLPAAVATTASGGAGSAASTAPAPVPPSAMEAPQWVANAGAPVAPPAPATQDPMVQESLVIPGPSSLQSTAARARTSRKSQRRSCVARRSPLTAAHSVSNHSVKGRSRDSTTCFRPKTPKGRESLHSPRLARIAGQFADTLACHSIRGGWPYQLGVRTTTPR